MKLDEETLMEIEDYIQTLDESVGLKSDTLLDVEKAISKQRKKLKTLTIPIVVVSETEVCDCRHEFVCAGRNIPLKSLCFIHDVMCRCGLITN